MWLICFLVILAVFAPLSAASSDPGATLEVSVESLMRKDLPNDFPFQVFDAGFAVLRVRMKNLSERSVEFSPDGIQALDPKGKKLAVAPPTEIAPKLMKYYRSGGPPSIHGEVGYGYPGYPRHPGYPDRRPTVGVGVPSGRVDVGTGAALRELLERYELGAYVLEPGQEYAGLLYLQSKKSGRALAGGKVRLADLEARIP